MADGHYSLAEVRRSLKRFVFGKATSSLIGIALLLLLVRVLPAAEYGAYMVLLAFMEVVQLGSNAGAYVAAGRYIPEARIAGDARTLRACVAGLLWVRVVSLAMVCLAAFVCAQWLCAWLGLSSYLRIAQIFLLVIFFEGLARFLDLIFDALLHQGWSQASIVMRNGLRLLQLWVLWSLDSDVSLFHWVLAEAVAAIAGCSVSLLALRSVLRAEAPIDGEGSVPVMPLLARYARFALPFYAGNLVYLAHSGDVARVVLSRLASLDVVAGFSFAGALASTVRRYTPVVLFQGMLRPMFVAAHERGLSTAQLSDRADMAMRMCLFVLLPMAVLLMVAGPEAASTLTGDRYPSLSSLLLLFWVLVAAYCARAVLEMLVSCYEGGRDMLTASVVALLSAVLAFSVIWGLTDTVTAHSMALVLLASEAGFIGAICFMLRRRHGVWIHPASGAYLRLLLCAGLAVLAGQLMRVAAVGFGLSTGMRLASVTVVVLLAFFGFATWIKPFTAADRELINDAVGRRMFVW